MKLLKPLKRTERPETGILHRKKILLLADDKRISYAIAESDKDPEFKVYKPKYEEYIYDDYVNHGVAFLEPMNAKEVTDTEKLDMMFNSEDYILEDKLDGTRATIHFRKDLITGESTTRVFSRRVSVKTNWLSENTDSLPQFSLMSIPELDGTVIDGELRMPGYEFKEVSSTLNCSWDKAIRRQMELNNITLFAFDILYYKGEDVTDRPLIERKELLKEVISIIARHYLSPHICMLAWYNNIRVDICLEPPVKDRLILQKEKYPTLFEDVRSTDKLREDDVSNWYNVSRKAYYEFVVLIGGEGVMLKPVNGVYSCGARKDTFMKVKKFLTRDCVVLGFTEPTKEYKGKYPDPKTWRYWESYDETLFDTSDPNQLQMVVDNIEEVAPVSKYYAEGWVGNIIAGVHITDEEAEKLPKKCKDDITTFKGEKYLIVAEISGYDEYTRAYFTKNQNQILGTVVEIKANDIFKDTGRLRHPRFLRMRPDKSASQCTYHDHIFA